MSSSTRITQFRERVIVAIAEIKVAGSDPKRENQRLIIREVLESFNWQTSVL